MMVRTGSMPENCVALYRTTHIDYPSSAPFHPAEPYPECEFGRDAGGEANEAYAAVRGALQISGLDAAHFGSAEWNPLRDYVRPGDVVLLKPNMIKESHPRDPRGWIYTLTHGSIVRAVGDYVFKALQGRGRVIVADAPQTDSSFSAMVRLLQFDELQEYYRAAGLEFELVDLRKEEWVNRDGVIVRRDPLPGDPNDYVAFRLDSHSEFVGHGGEGRYYGADYDTGEVNRHHAGGRHEYLISGSAVKCDVFINLPKLKTHKKAGITVNLKNLVGINGDKNWLPHHTNGSPADGGDQYPELYLGRRIEHHSTATFRKMALAVPVLGPWAFRQARRVGTAIFGSTSKVIRSGNWHGNDTTWRMCLDLNKALLYGSGDGTMRSGGWNDRKTYLCFVDGIIAGQGDGPMDPDPAPCGIIAFGANAASVDAASAVLMGFSPEKLPVVRQAFETKGFPLARGTWQSVTCVSNHAGWSGPLDEVYRSGDVFRFRPHFGWVGHVERD